VESKLCPAIHERRKMENHFDMKKFSSLLVLALTGCACLQPVHSQWSGYPGAGRLGMCAEYAVAATVSLKAVHCEAHYVQYNYKFVENRNWFSRSRPFIGAHAVCLFKQNGAWWMVDNQTMTPVQVYGDMLPDKCRYYATHQIQPGIDDTLKVWNAQVKEVGNLKELIHQ
jgi:hypothetical protein